MLPNEDDWAVLWCRLLGPILLDDVEPGERRRFLRELSRQSVKLPNGIIKCLSLSTLRRKVRRFRESRLVGLQRQARRDRGRSRKDRQALLVRAAELKREQPRRSPDAINLLLSHEFGRTIPTSTMNRHLRKAGATRRKLGIVKEKIRCRWTRDHSNALWVGDFADGPCVWQAERVIRTHVSVWIDCHSRFVVEGRYYFKENLDILIDSLLRAWGSHGAPRELYVDNAKIYHSRALRLACTQLNIQLLHRPPRDPPAGGLIERIIQTTQDQFESEVRAGKTLNLDDLNRYFQGWLQARYHQNVHSETGEMPQARFTANTRYFRHVNMAEASRLFYVREKRKVDPKHYDVQLNHRHFAVRPEYRGDSVIVHYDPFTRSDEVEIYSRDGIYLQRAPGYERAKGTHPFAERQRAGETATPLDHHYLELLAKQHEEQSKEAAAHGMSYHAARGLMTFVQFADTLAKLLGRKGGVSSWSGEELEILAKVHRRYPRVTASHLRQACERAEAKTLPLIVFQLQQFPPD
jgi:putative transposase